MRKLFPLSVIASALVMTSPVNGQTTLTIDGNNRGPEINATQYGLFYEEINHAGDGGLYAELIRNRSFEDNQKSPEQWTAVSGAHLSLLTAGLLNKAQHQALLIQTVGPVTTVKPQGASNDGFWGINAVKGRTYTLTFWAKSVGAYSGSVTGALRSKDGTKTYARVSLKGLTAQWKKFSAKMASSTTDPEACFALLLDKQGKVAVDVVSLFPPTFKNRPNGCRPDLAQLLADTKPAFMRFPGGCYVEGVRSYENAFQWRRTVGPIETRPGHWNLNWGYRVSDGMGFHEFLQLCEDIGARPLYVVNLGLGHGYTIPVDSLQPLIQTALDALEYANGDASTPCGRMRIANGHKAPFNIQYLELGNENYQANVTEQSYDYPQRYALFRKAILAKYPKIHLIANVEAWGTDHPTWRNDNPVELVDEHYYRSFSWCRNNYDKYDNFPRNSYKVYNGEYAANEGGTYGQNGTISSALGEAIYMLGMERNADVCTMASFAPIFTHEQDRRWDYDMIHFTNAEVFCTPSYYVQKLMSHNVGKQNLKFTESANSLTRTGGRIGLGTWKTAASYKQVAVTSTDDRFLLKDNFADASGWTPAHGNWNTTDGVYTQTGKDENSMSVSNTDLGTDHYTLSLQACKQGGEEGFLIVFNYRDKDNYCWWNIGGWGNTTSAVECCSGGGKTTYARTAFQVKDNQWYNIRLEVRGVQVTGYIDDQKVVQFTLPSQRHIYTSTTIDDASGLLYVKIVNPEAEADQVHLNFQNLHPQSGTWIRLSGQGPKDENTLTDKTCVVPADEQPLEGVSDSMTFRAPPFSLSILKLKIAK